MGLCHFDPLEKRARVSKELQLLMNRTERSAKSYSYAASHGSNDHRSQNSMRTRISGLRFQNKRAVNRRLQIESVTPFVSKLEIEEIKQVTILFMDSQLFNKYHESYHHTLNRRCRGLNTLRHSLHQRNNIPAYRINSPFIATVSIFIH